MANKRPGLRASINAFCKECLYDPHCGGGTWREQIGACTSYKCPLFPVRPVPSGYKGPDRAKSEPKTRGNPGKLEAFNRSRTRNRGALEKLADYSSADHQIELAKESLKGVPEWVHEGPRQDGSDTKGKYK